MTPSAEGKGMRSKWYTGMQTFNIDCFISYLTRHGLGAVTGYNLESDASPHFPLCIGRELMIL